jgi:hypothetical protein
MPVSVRRPKKLTGEAFLRPVKCQVREHEGQAYTFLKNIIFSILLNFLSLPVLSAIRWEA